MGKTVTQHCFKEKTFQCKKMESFEEKEKHLRKSIQIKQNR